MRALAFTVLIVVGAFGFASSFGEGFVVQVFKGTVGAGLALVEKLTPITTQNAQKATKKGIDDLTNAADAVAKFADQQRRLPVDTVAQSFRQKNVGKSFEYLVTHPVRQTNKDAQQAMKSSPVLAAAAAVAASAYGGPAGAAAFAAWTTYNATGSIEAALKVGVTQGLIASATAGVNAMPAGADKIAAKTALSAAVAKAEGESSEEQRRAALGSLVSMSSESVKAAGLSVTQRTFAMSAIGGAAVAASGGNRDAIRTGFLQGGGKVLAQELNAAKEDAKNTAENAAKAHVGAVLSEQQIAAADKAYQRAKVLLTDNQVAQKIAAAKKEYEKTKTAVQVNVADRTARLTNAREVILAQRATIQKEEDGLKKATVAIQSDTARKLAQTGAAAAKVRAEEARAIQALNAQSKQATALTNAEISRVSESVRADVASAISDEIQGAKRVAQFVLDDGTIVTWDPKDLTAAKNANTSVQLAVPTSAESLLDYFYAPRP